MTIQFTPRRSWGLIAALSASVALASLILTPLLALDPCHLCIVQRTLFLLLALVATAAAFTTPQRLSARLLGGLSVILSATGSAVAVYQSWLQWQPPDTVSCISSALSLIEQAVEWLGERLPTLFLATGFCEDRELVIFGLSLANLAALLFTALLALTLWTLVRSWRRGIKI
jgi:protein dithiol:quinone oxidoreductase